MTVRERILAIKLLEKQEKKPEYANRIGIRAEMKPRSEKVWRKNYV